jgi:MFS transporter, ACS family, D-galactonate transporter
MTSKMTGAQQRLMILLFLSVAINYIDRGNLSVAAPTLSAALKIRPDQLGALHSLFFLTYVLCQIPAGWMVDRFNVNMVFAAGYALWSLATGLTGFVSTFFALASLRLLLGVGESIAFPSYSKLLANVFSEHQRGMANALIDSGTKIGPTLGILVGGLIVSHLGWRYVFFIVGFISMAWLVPWFKWAPQTVHQDAKDLGPCPPLAEIVRQRAAWGTFLGLLCINYAWYFLLTWMPYWMVKERHFSLDHMALFGSIPYAGAAVSSIAWGWLSDRLIRRGCSPTKVRKRFVVTGLLTATVMLPAVVVSDNMVSIGLITLSLFCFTLTSTHWAISQTLAGPVAAGKWTGMQNFVGNMAGLTAPAITGLIVQHTGEFFYAFVAAAVALVLGACSFGLLIREVAPIQWRAQA